MKKKYFIKWLPENSKVLMVGGMYWNKQYQKPDLISSSMHLEVLVRGNFQPAKEFVCSREIKQGDTIHWWLNPSDYKNEKLGGWKSAQVASILDEGYGVYTFDLADKDEYPSIQDIIPFDDAYKIIGEKSPNSTWVKEGMEFSEDEVKFRLLDPSHLKLHVDVSEEEFVKDDAPDVYKEITFKCPCCESFK